MSVCHMLINRDADERCMGATRYEGDVCDV